MKKVLLSLSLVSLGLAGTMQAQTFTQTFESVTMPALPTGWNNTTTGGGNGWVTNAASYTWPNRGFYAWPLYSIPAHTQYCFVDDDGHFYNNPSKLTTHVFSLVGVTNPTLSYDCFYIKAHLGSTGPAEQAWVEISTNSGSTWSFLDSITAAHAWITKSVSLSAYSTATTCQLRFVYTDNGGSTATPPSGIIGVAVDNISVFSAVANDISIIDLVPRATDIGTYYLPSATATLAAQVRNNGTTPITSFTFGYQAGASAPVTSTITPATPIAAFTTYTFAATTPLAVPAGNTNVKVWASLTGDAIHTNDSSSTAVVGVPSFPAKNMLFEEATGTWCGYCVRGIIYMDSLYKLHKDNVSIVSVHNGDPMASANTSTTRHDALMGTYISGYPSMVIDRRDDAVTDPSSCIAAYDALNGNVFGFATMSMTPTYTATTVGATVTVNPVTNMSGNYTLEMIVTEEKVHGTSSTYAQHNYYSSTNPGGSAGALSGVGYNFTDSLPIIPAASMYYPFVSRITVPSDISTTNGVAGSLPATMTAGTPYTYTFAPVTFPSTFNKDYMRVVIALIDNNTNKRTYGYVLNSTNSGKTANELLGVNGVTAGNVEDMRVFPNPASDMAHIAFNLKETSNVEFTIFDMTGRVAFTHASEKMNAGGNQINISTANLAAGVYNVVITTANGTVTERLSVVK